MDLFNKLECPAKELFDTTGMHSQNNQMIQDLKGMLNVSEMEATCQMIGNDPMSEGVVNGNMSSDVVDGNTTGNTSSFHFLAPGTNYCGAGIAFSPTLFCLCKHCLYNHT